MPTPSLLALPSRPSAMRGLVIVEDNEKGESLVCVMPDEAGVGLEELLMAVPRFLW